MAELTELALERLREAQVGRLATVTPAGEPHIVPIVFAVDDGAVYTAVDHKPKSTARLARLANLAANPRAALLVDHYNDDWSRLWWIRVDGRADLHEPGSPVHPVGSAALRAAYPRHYAETQFGTMIRITPTIVRTWGLNG